jgi:preprotein translocase subunit SecE
MGIVNINDKVIQFFKDAYYELTKVIWLGKKEVIGITLIVVIFIIAISIFVSVTDLFLGMIISIML